MKILSIDTSCDETSAAVTDGNRVLSNVVWSQASLHAKWGGVVPSLARRAHQERLPWVVSRALRLSKAFLPSSSPSNPDPQPTTHNSQPISAIAVTIGPGLAPALEAGIHYAKQFALLHKIPLIPVNHLEGHAVSAFALPKSKIKNQKSKISFPAIALIVSGGHTQLVIIKIQGVDHSEFSIQNSVFEYRLLADTLDDALGEALDKAARMLGLGYPGGAVLEKFAKQGDPKKYKLPRPLLGKENQGRFSFSGLKTAFYRLVQSLESPSPGESKRSAGLAKQEIYDLAACFQSTAFDHLLRVISRTLSDYKNYNNYNLYNILIGGGVAANVELRRRLRKLAKELNLKIHFPYSKKLCTDNAAMIGLAAQFALNRGEALTSIDEITGLDRHPNLNFD